MLHGIDGAAACRDFSVNSAQTTLVNLNSLRSDRLASLQSGFPIVHWLILGLLSSSIILLFLIDSNQDVLQYLNSLQLRLLFAILLGAFSATAGLCIDLADPFRGVTTINNAAAQLVAFEEALERDIDAVDEDLRSIEATGAQDEHGRASWGARDTVYFHLLTGKPGSTVRLLGDVVAWGTRRFPGIRRDRRSRTAKGKA